MESRHNFTKGDEPSASTPFLHPSNLIYPPRKRKVTNVAKWDKFEDHIRGVFAELFYSTDFMDVTLVCDHCDDDDGEFLHAHQFVLSMASSFFRRSFKEASSRHPVVIIKGLTKQTLKTILRYIYLGEVTVPDADIPKFMEALAYLGVSMK